MKYSRRYSCSSRCSSCSIPSSSSSSGGGGDRGRRRSGYGSVNLIAYEFLGDLVFKT